MSLQEDDNANGRLRKRWAVTVVKCEWTDVLGTN